MTLSVVHVLPLDLSRGAQVVARELRERLEGIGDPPQQHRTLTLFRGQAAGLDPDVRLDVPAGPLRRLWADPRAVVRLRKALRRLLPDVVVAHGGEPMKYCALAMPAGARLVAYKIGVVADNLADRRFRLALHRRLARAADLVVAVSDEVADEAVSLLRCDPDDVVVIPNGRDPELFTPAPGSDDGVVRLIWVSHVERPKRPLWFVELVRRLVADGLNVHGTMVGDGPMLAEVRTAAADLPIEVLGRRGDVPKLLARSDVLVLTSQREGMPGVLVEAGMSGLPVVTTDVAGARTIVDPDSTGHVVPVDDLDALVRRAQELVAAPDRRRNLGKAAHNRCLTHFSLDKVAQQWAHTLVSLPNRDLR